jgi:epoxide hydrolase 4
MTDEKISFDYAQIGGARLHYAKAGDGERLVVLLHGFPECWYSWRHQLRDLSDEFTVVAPDLRGYNLSDKPASVADYDIHKLVDDIIGLIHHFGREKAAAVIGHDWGAAVAWALAANHPESVSKIGALQVPPAPVWRKNFTLRQLLASWYMFFFQIPALPEYLLKINNFALLKNAMRNTTYEKGVFSDEDIAVYRKAWSEPFALTGMLNYYRANIPRRLFSKPEKNSKIKVPALFIYGERDQAVLPETVRGIGDFIEAPFEEFRIPTSAHWVQQEAADAVTEILREFLSDRETV